MAKRRIDNVCMIVYTQYSSDQRVRREAEAVASLPGVTVHVLTLKEKEAPRDFILGGVHIHELGMEKYRGKSNLSYIFSYLEFVFRAFAVCTRMFFEKKVDAVHIHNMPNFLIFSALVPFLAGRQIVLDVHDTLVETYAAKFEGRPRPLLDFCLRMEEKICCAMADTVIAVNHVQKAALVSRGVPDEKIVISINVPDPGKFATTKEIRLRDSKDGSKRMVYHGTVTGRLGIDIGIQAVFALKERMPDLEFHIVGDGEDLEEFKALSIKLGVQDRVKFYGRVPLEELIPIVETMDLGLVPNRRNVATELMMPVKLLECIGLGIPVVAPRLKTINHYFTDDMLFLFEPEDVLSLCDAILKAFGNDTRRLETARNARKFLDTYGWETHKRDLLDLYTH